MKISACFRLLICCLLLMLAGATAVYASDLSKLIDRECRNCHSRVIKKLQAAGSPHATEVECRDCHTYHPQRHEEPKVNCGSCHAPETSEHYKYGNCQQCHHAHWPLEIDFSRINAPVQKNCLSCHSKQIKPAKSKHLDEMDCVGCHSSHDYIPNCLDCHEGHGDDQRLKDCQQCHPAHKPVPATFKEGLDPSLCGSCHSSTTNSMKKAGGAHARQACTDCHNEHGDKPSCLNCHEPHSQKMAAGDCKSCHSHHQPLPLQLQKGISFELCTSCHEETAASFEANGAAHKANLNCADCHLEHPPSKKAIPKCSMCHDKSDNAHFGVKNCQTCHDPHQPEVGDLTDIGKVMAACVPCHEQPGQDMAPGSSKHAELDCSSCHIKHGDVPTCLDCHDPHNDKMTAADCATCHAPHRPSPSRFKPGTDSSLCADCHADVSETFAASGGLHQESMDCAGCHEEHPPSEKAIPACNQCHAKEENPHFAVANCAGCHNPHSPAVNDLSALENVRPVCASCHEDVIAEMDKGATAHSEDLSCNQCHQQHGQIPSCLDCHEGHNDKMTQADCVGCHSPHRPAPPQFNPGTDSSLCADCHEDVSALFTASGGRHQESMDCAGCHEEHPPSENAIPTCASCHASEENPHFAVGNCSDCHNPHSPGVKDLSALENARPVCASCHADVIAEMDKGATAHSEEVACNQCHQQHGQIPSCLDCHEGHDDEMQVTGCVNCHNAHRPMPVEFLEGTAAVLCSACHADPVAEITTAGGAHKEQNVIPECASCHDEGDNPHFATADCTSCHNPHQPVLEDISYLDDSRPVCAGCHAEVDQQLTAQISAHSEQGCVECHQQHADAPSCLGCHEGHSEQMKQADCLTCHQPHAPLSIHLKNEPEAQLCAACHSAQTSSIAKAGASHRDQLGCVSCHEAHPASACADCHSVHPQKGQGIPQSCFICHEASSHPHFAVGDCQECHDPHEPLNLNLKTRKPLTPVCVTCHQQVQEQFVAMPGGHSTQDCGNCHADHSKKRKCLDCHQPHEKSMTQGDCLHCHSPHQPQDIQFRQADDLPTKFCASCHTEQAETVAAKGEAHHQELDSCTACHPEHLPNGKNTKLDCGSCHDRGERRHFTLENCSSCHNPHQPLEMDLSKLSVLAPACVSCHNNQERLIAQNPSKHSAFDCRKCHAGEHGSKKECLECHKPHIPDMSYQDCLKCHPPHFPQLIKEKPGQAGKVCAGCHQDASSKMKTAGGAHNKQPCVSCHQAHPPAEERVMPACSICHGGDDNAHFAVENCAECHQAHQPLGHDLSKVSDAKPACQACHAEVATTFASQPSAHAEQDCTQCHLKHGEAQQCGDCHDPHSQDMKYADCLNCHRAPHAPMQIAFAGEMPSNFCQSCHSDQVEALAATPTKHGELACVECHLGDHGAKANCVDCHELPHEPALHKKFPDCLKCHIDPHDLADWRGGEQAKIKPPALIISIDNQPAKKETTSSEDVK